jgi:hypothetical protein
MLAPFSLIDNSQTVLDAVMEELGTGIDQIEDDAMSENVENLKTSDTDMISSC